MPPIKPPSATLVLVVPIERAGPVELEFLISSELNVPREVISVCAGLTFAVVIASSATFAVVILASVILAVVIAVSATFAVVMLASVILAVVTALSDRLAVVILSA